MHKLDKRKVMKRRELKMDRMYKQSSDPFFSLIFLLFSCYFLFLSSKSDHRIVYCWNSRLQSCNSVWISAVRMFSICYSLCCNLLAALQSFQQESPSQYDPICLHLNYYPHQFFGRGGLQRYMCPWVQDQHSWNCCKLTDMHTQIQPPHNLLQRLLNIVISQYHRTTHAQTPWTSKHIL